MSDRRQAPDWDAAREEAVDRLFVYGTLRAGQPARSMIANLITDSEPATTPGLLYALPGAYPGMLPGDGTVRGELVTLSDLTAAFALLDAYEGDEFSRVLREVIDASGDVVQAWCYVLDEAEAVVSGALIEHGDWLAFRDDSL